MKNKINRLVVLALAILLLIVSVQADDGFEDVFDNAPYAEAVEDSTRTTQ